MDLKVLISAPGDQVAEVEAAQQAVSHLDELLRAHGHSITTKHWQLNLSTGRGDRAQDVINDQTTDCDAIIAIIGPRLGTSTGKFNSGTVEEIEQFLANSRPNGVGYDVHVFFNTQGLENPFEIDAEQLKKAQQFREALNERGISYAQFSSIDALKKLVQIGLNTLISKEKPAVEDGREDPLAEFEELGSYDAEEEATKHMKSAMAATEEIASALISLSSSLNLHQENYPKDRLNRDDARRWLNGAAEILESTRCRIEPSVREMRSRFALAYANLNLAVSIELEDAVAADDTVDFSELSTGIDEMLKNISSARTGISNMTTSLSKIPRRTKELRKAKKELSEEFNRTIDGFISFEIDLKSLYNLIS
ncbi:MAG: hypothetical protein AAF224_07855 [Pseudomonadota bacterium]